MSADPLASEYVFDVDKWTNLFPLSEADELSAGIIVSPLSLAYLVQLRALAIGSAVRSVPTDVFAFALGEPPRRDVTKVGGLPYRPKDKQWPKGPDGKALTFLAQYRFVESKDIVPVAPNDILLVFIGGPNIRFGPKWFGFEWYSVEMLESSLAGPADVPAPGFDFISCFGVRYRTVDYLDFEEVKAKLEAFVSDDTLFESQSVRQTCWIDGMKISGLPSWQDLDDPRIESASDLQFLCSLPAIYPRDNCIYPWINHAEPIAPKPMQIGFESKTSLYFGDGFGFYFFLDSNKSVIPFFQYG